MSLWEKSPMSGCFDVLCPRCGSDRSGLLGCAHDYINDCSSCRGRPTGANVKRTENQTTRFIVRPRSRTFAFDGR
jgi:hypothetical protein